MIIMRLRDDMIIFTFQIIIPVRNQSEKIRGRETTNTEEQNMK